MPPNGETINCAGNLINKKNSLYRLPQSFYLYQLLALTLTGLLFLWLARNEALDRALTGYWFDSATMRFAWQDNIWLERLNHRLLKDIIIAGAAFLLIRGLIKRQPRQVTVALMMGLGALTVGLLKAVSAHSCPWSLVEYGGSAVGFPLLGEVPANSGPGQCFPGGHSSSGFMTMALFFLYYRERPRLAWLWLVIGITLGLAMGYGQVMRGAHFFSHNLWAGWWVWLTQVVSLGFATAFIKKGK